MNKSRMQMERLLNNCSVVKDMLGEIPTLVFLYFLHEENDKPKTTLLRQDIIE